MCILKKEKICLVLAVIMMVGLFTGCSLTVGSNKENEELKIEVKVDKELPESVVNYALDKTQSDLDYFTKELGYKMVKAELLDIEQIMTGTTSEVLAINLYKIKYRFKPENPEDIQLSGDMFLTEDYLTSDGTGHGDIYIILYKKTSSEQKDWEPVCVTNEVTMTEEYFRPGIVEKYEDMYSAAAMMNYEKHIKEKNAEKDENTGK